MARIRLQATSTRSLGLGTPGPHTWASDSMPSCIPAMRSWNTRAFATMALAMRRVWGTFAMPSRRATAAVMAGRVASRSSRTLAAFSMPASSVSVALSTARCGTDTSRTMSATVVHRAFQPALFGEADRIIVALGEDAVRQAGRLQRGVEVVGLGHVFGVAERDGGLDGPAGGGHLQAEPVLRLRLDGGGGKVLRLHDDGRATGGRDEYVGTQARSPGDGLRVFGDHVAARQHGL